MKIDHKERARLAWPYLAARANEAEKPNPFTYKEIGDKIGVHYRAVGHFMSIIQDYCKKYPAKPPLQALVVHAADRLPGTGYDGSRITREDHDRALAEVGSTEWPETPPVDL